MVGHLFQNYDTIYVHENHEKWKSKEREAGGRLLKCENTKQKTWNL